MSVALAISFETVPEADGLIPFGAGLVKPTNQAHRLQNETLEPFANGKRKDIFFTSVATAEQFCCW